MIITKNPRRRFVKRLIVGLFLVALAGIAVIAILTYLKNQADNNAKVTRDPSSYTRASDDGKQDREGRNELPVTENILDGYTVAPNKPRAMYIEKLGIAARILPMGTNPNGAMQAPLNIYDAGWYNQSALPSEDGVLAVDGHASGPTKEGLFGRLNDLSIGDRVRVETGDGTNYQYEVVHKEDLGRGDVDMKKFLLPYGQNSKGLNLMTCAGDWEKGAQTFSNRIVVYTRLVES